MINIETKTAINASVRIAVSHANALEHYAGESFLFTREDGAIVDMDNLRSRNNDDGMNDKAATQVIKLLNEIGMTPQQYETVEYLHLWL